MSELDIRDIAAQIDVIRFSEDSPYTSCSIKWYEDSRKICFNGIRVNYSDIDNLIKALEKAKEIWGN